MLLLLIIYIAFVLLAFLGLLCLDYGSLRRKPAEAGPKEYRPSVLVIVPCKGRDLTLLENLKSLNRQEYARYRVIAVVDDEKDSAIPLIRKAGLDYIISEVRSKRSSGKVNALLTALLRYRNYEAYAIADSDIIVDSLWLGRLVKPLGRKGVGLSTMYPYFNPMGGFWSKVKLVWGFVGEGLMEDERTRFGWGGSLAFRKDLVDRRFIGIAENSVYAVSDDISLTKAAEARGLKIAYTRQSQPRVNTAESFGSFAEWSNRQTALSILGYRRNLYVGMAYYSAEIFVFLSGIILATLVSPFFLLLFAHLAKGLAKTYRRAGRLDPAIGLIAIAMPFIYLSNLAVAAGMKGIRWRGSYYPLR